MRIGQVVFEPTTGEVHQPTGQVSRLEPQPAAVLAVLASAPGKLVRHEDLRHALWGDTVHVSFQQNLHYAIRQVRRGPRRLRPLGPPHRDRPGTRLPAARTG